MAPLLALLALTAGGCGSEQASPAGAGKVTVFAAASLTEAFTEMGKAFERLNQGTTVIFNFAASSELVTQIDQGAPADVFASADPTTMAKLTDSGKAARAPATFATNLAEIIVEAGNPKGIRRLADLAGPGLVVVTCAPEVPCGRYARQIIDRAGVTVTPKSLESNVKAVVSKVTVGEADAGIVYVTDVVAAGDAVTGVPIPAEVNVTATYPIVVTTHGAASAVAKAFVDFVLSAAGQAILTTYGFGAP